jgi:hypothetical protein
MGLKIFKYAECFDIMIFHCHCKERLLTWIQDYEDAFTELVLLGQKSWNDDEIKERLFSDNQENICLIDNVS